MKRLLLLAFLICSVSAQAQETTFSQRLSFSGNYSTDGSASYSSWSYGRSLREHDTSIYFQLGYAKRLTSMIDLALDPYVSYNKSGGEYKVYRFGIALGPVFNFDQDYSNSLFLSPAISLNTIKYSGAGFGSNANDTYFSYSLELGKRFSLSKLIGTDAVTYSPSLAVNYTDRSDDYSDYKLTTYKLSFLQFEVHF